MAIIKVFGYSFVVGVQPFPVSNILFQDRAMYCTTQNQIAEFGSMSEDRLVHQTEHLTLRTESVIAGCSAPHPVSQGWTPYNFSGQPFQCLISHNKNSG